MRSEQKKPINIYCTCCSSFQDKELTRYKEELYFAHLYLLIQPKLIHSYNKVQKLTTELIS